MTWIVGLPIVFAGISAVADAQGLFDRKPVASSGAAPTATTPTTPTTATVAPGGSTAPVVTDSSPPRAADPTTVTSAGADADGWVVQHPLATLKVVKPGLSCRSTKVDLDRFTARSSNETPAGTDLYYSDCGYGGLKARDAQQFGEGPTTMPTAPECAAQAGSSGLDIVEAGDMTARETAFCVVTDEDRVAWLHLVRRGPLDDNENADLEFRAIVWER